MSRCPLCNWEQPAVQDQLEAERRNAAQDAARKHRFTGYVTEFRAQGYGTEAAQAMANKRFREDNMPSRTWTLSDIEYERKRAESQRNIDAGEVMRCPSCKNYAPVGPDLRKGLLRAS